MAAQDTGAATLVASPPTNTASVSNSKIPVRAGFNLPPLAPIALHDGSKMFEPKVWDPSAGTIEYQTLDGRLSKSLKWNGQEWSEPAADIGTNTKPIRRLYTAVPNPIELRDFLKVLKKSDNPQDQKICSDFNKGDKEGIKQVYQRLGWGTPSGETEKLLVFTNIKEEARITYYLSDDGKQWSTIIPRWFTDQQSSKKETSIQKGGAQSPYVEPAPSIAHEVYLQTANGHRAGQKVEKVLKGCSHDVYYQVLQRQNPGSLSSYQTLYWQEGGIRHPDKARFCGVFGNLSPSAAALTSIVTTAPYNLPDITSPTHGTVQAGLQFHVGYKGAEIVIAGDGSDLNLPSTYDQETGQQLTTGGMVVAGVGLRTNTDLSAQGAQVHVPYLGDLSFFKTGETLLQVGGGWMVSPDGNQHSFPLIVISSRRNLIEFYPGSGPISVSAQLRSDSLFFPSNGGPINPTQPNSDNWTDLIKTRNPLYFSFRVGYNPYRSINPIGFLDPHRVPDGAEVITAGVTSFLNALNLLSTMEGNISYDELRKRADSGNFTLIGARGLLVSAGLPFFIHGPQDYENGNIAKRLGWAKGAALLAGQALASTFLFVVPGALEIHPYKSETDPKEHMNYAERLHAALLPTGIQELAGAGISALYAVLPDYTAKQPWKIAVTELANVGVLALGVSMVVAPGAFVPGFQGGPNLGNNPVAEDYNHRLQPEFLGQQRQLSTVAGVGGRMAGAALTHVARRTEWALRQYLAKGTQEGLGKATVEVTPGAEEGTPKVTDLFKIGADIASDRGQVVVEGKCDWDIRLVGGSCTPSKSRAKDRKLDQLQGELDTAKIQLAALEKSLDTEEARQDAKLRAGREVRVAQLKEKISSLQEEINQIGESKHPQQKAAVAMAR